jgi:hypothetical protein
MTTRLNRLALGALATAAASLAFAAPGMAAGAQSISVPYDGIVLGNVCNGEEITLQGDAHFVGHGDFEQEGATQHVVLHQNFQGVSGIGSFGNEYRFVDTGHSFQQSTEGGATVIASETQLNVVGKRDTVNFSIQVVFHTTINANGDATSEVENFHVNCNGGGGPPIV